MRERAPEVYEWQSRLWNARGSQVTGNLVDGVPADWGPLLEDVGSAYLPYLCANAEAWSAREKRHDATIEGVVYRHLPVSRYRVWCLERLREHFEGIGGRRPRAGPGATRVTWLLGTAVGGSGTSHRIMIPTVKSHFAGARFITTTRDRLNLMRTTRNP